MSKMTGSVPEVNLLLCFEQLKGKKKKQKGKKKCCEQDSTPQETNPILIAEYPEG